ncbi:MAG: glycoside hydrolase family 32 protein [Treponema sp.]|jgi:beta-fructofuranosidase|nr:glycoside hydrolase family 32 protein [Treponema sp.]
MQDYYRPVYHFTARQGWMNDPNGLIQFRGTYHAFYQHYPYAPKWGPMHWGHAVSRDLVHWEHLPIALYPDQDYEKGCFTGSAVDNNGELTLVYTAHHDERSPRETQCLAFSRDGIYFTKYEKNPVIKGPPPGYGEEFRDPKVFRRGEDWYIVVGCTRENRGGVLLYTSPDLRRWDLVGLFCESDGAQGIMWECPNFFQLDGAWVLLISPIDMEKARCIFITGEADFEKPAFMQKKWSRADYGLDFYAPQVFTDERGRCILLGWMDMWGDFPTRKDGWAGAFTFPRQLFLEGATVCQRPVEELALLRRKELFNGNLKLRRGQKNNLANIQGDCLEIEFTIPRGKLESGVLTMLLRASADRKERVLLQWDLSSQVFTLDKEQSGSGQGDTPKPAARKQPWAGLSTEKTSIPLEEDGEKQVHILVDRSSIEIFLCGGKFVFTNWIFPRPASVFYDLFMEGAELSIPDLKIFELGSGLETPASG